MKKIIDLQTFQKITTDCMRVHETVRSTEPLTAEAERILQLADSLLREAGLAYLNECQNLDLPSLPNSEQATPPEQVVENFIGVQHALVDLKQALYQVMRTYIAEQRWPELKMSFTALLSLEEKGVDVSNVVEAIEDPFIQLMQTQVAEQRWSELATSITALLSLGGNTSSFSSIVDAIEDTFIPQAEDLLESEEWDKGRALLRPWLFSPKVRSYYYTSYVDQSYALQDNHPVRELKSQLPESSGTFCLDHISSSDSSYLAMKNWVSRAREEVYRIVVDPNFNPNQVS